MAGGFDGSIKIDTQLDNAGFKRGSEELRTAVRSLTDTVNNTGRQLQNAFKFDFGTPKQAVYSFSQAVKEVRAEIAQMGEVGQSALEGDEEALSRFSEMSGATLSKLDEMQTELERFGDTEFVRPEYAKAEGEYIKAADRVKELETALEEAQTAYDALMRDFGSSEEYEQLENLIESLKNSKAEYEAAVKRGDQISAAEIYSSANPQGGFDNAIAKAEEKMQAMWDKFESSRALTSAEKQINSVTSQLEDAKNTAAQYKAELDSCDKTFTGRESETFERDQEAIRGAIDELVEYRRLVDEGTATGQEWNTFSGITESINDHLDQFQDTWQNMTSLSGMVSGAFSTISNGALQAGAAVSTSLAHPIQSVDRILGTVASTALRTASSLAQVASGAIASGIRAIATAAKNAAVNLLSMAKSAVISGIKKLGNAIKNLGKKSTKSNRSLATSFKTLLKYGLGIRSLYVLFNKIRTAITEGFGEIAQVDTKFNKVMSDFKTALTYLKNSLAAAFAPLAETILPTITTLITKMAEGLNTVGSLFSALAGNSEFAKAVPVQEDYAESVKNSGKNADSATKSQKKLNKAAKDTSKTLAGFDDINILKDDSSEDEEESKFAMSGITKGVSDWAQKLKEMWEKADFSELGRKLGEKLRDALTNIDWDKVKETLRKIAKSIATFLNGFLETPGLFSAIGKTIAEAINSAFAFVEEFVRNFNWKAFGTAIKDLILGVLNNLDWDLIFKTLRELGSGLGTALESAFNNPEIWNAIFTALTNLLNAVVYGAIEFFKAVDWGDLGKNIATGLNNAINNIDWNALAQALILLVNSAFDFLYNFVTTFDWKKFGTKIGTLISDAIKGIDWKTGGASVAAAVQGLFDALTAFMEAVDWKEVGKAVTDALGAFFEEFDWGSLASFLSTFTTSLFTALTGAIENIEWSEVPQKIIDAIQEFVENYDFKGIANSAGELIGAAFKAVAELGGSLWEKMKEFGKSVMEGGFQGIIDALASVGTWIKENILDPFIDGFKKTFGIGSPAKEMEPMGGYIIDGMLEGIKSALTSIGTWIKEHIWDPFCTAFKTAFGISDDSSSSEETKPFGEGIIGGMLQGIIDALVGIGEWISTNIVDPVVSGIRSMFGLDGGEESRLVTIGKDVIGGIKDGITNAMTGISDWVKTTIVEPITGAIDSLFGLNGKDSVLATAGGNLISGLKNGVTGALTGVSGWVSNNITTPICGAVEDLWEIGSPSRVFEEYGGYLMEGMQDGVEKSEDEPKGALEGVQKNMRNVFTNLKDIAEWANVGSNLMVIGLKVGIGLKQQEMIDAILKVEKAMRDAVGKMADEWKNVGTALVAALKSGLGGTQTIGQESMTNLQKGMTGMGDNLRITAQNLVTTIKNQFSAENWYNIGVNIGQGIQNGINASAPSLNTTAGSTAQQLVDTTAGVLQIASPSKKFAWIGEMVTAGLGEGIESTRDSAVGAVVGVADAIVSEAESAQPVMQIGTALDGMDSVLGAFSDKLISGFAEMVSSMERILGGSSLLMPAMAGGAVAPYAARQSAYDSQQADDGFHALADALSQSESTRITREDLIEILRDVCTEYISFDFYIGDEQIARHSNAGNRRLGRRMSATMA